MKTGDRVKAFGNLGTIKRISESGIHFVVKFDDIEDLMVFYLDGKLFKWNKNPTLEPYTEEDANVLS